MSVLYNLHMKIIIGDKEYATSKGLQATFMCVDSMIRNTSIREIYKLVYYYRKPSYAISKVSLVGLVVFL